MYVQLFRDDRQESRTTPRDTYELLLTVEENSQAHEIVLNNFYGLNSTPELVSWI